MVLCPGLPGTLIVSFCSYGLSINSFYYPFTLKGVLTWTISTIMLCKAVQTRIFPGTQVRCHTTEGINYFTHSLCKLYKLARILWNVFTGNLQGNILLLNHNIAKEIKQKRKIYRIERTKANWNLYQITGDQGDKESLDIKCFYHALNILKFPSKTDKKEKYLF